MGGNISNLIIKSNWKKKYKKEINYMWEKSSKRYDINHSLKRFTNELTFDDLQFFMNSGRIMK
jgi:hypothetical protein